MNVGSGVYIGDRVTTIQRSQIVEPGLLLKWRLARAKVLNGTADAKALCIGTSKTMGYQTTAGNSNTAWPGFLATMWNTAGLPAAQGLGIPSQTGQPGVVDSRWATTGTVGQVGQNSAGMASDLVSSGSAYYLGTSASITYTPASGSTYDRFDIYYYGSSAVGFNGTLSATATGGGAGTVDTSLANAISKLTVSAGSASTSNSVVLTETSGSKYVEIIGVEPWLSTTKRVRVADAGVSGSTTGQWATNPTIGGALNYIQYYAADLTYIFIDTNDANVTVGTLSVPLTVANLRAIVTAAQVSGDVIIGTEPPTQGLPYTAGLTSKLVRSRLTFHPAVIRPA